jgi:UDP-3-O-[3-hydroxymyristoyl] glucosamine N-acyltransferase
MADPRFFARAGPFALDTLAGCSGARLLHPQDASRTIYDVAALDTAGPSELSFFDNRKYLDAFLSSRAGAAFVDERAAARAPPTMAPVVTSEPYKAFARAAQLFYPAPAVRAGRAPSALIAATAVVPEDCEIGPNVVIGPGARLGRGCRIEANSVVGAGVEIGDDCVVGANVSLSHCLVGARVVLHPGARIGQPGFGFAPDPTGPMKIPQLGRVVIGDDVEIGANTTIDRGSLHDTIIGAGSMIDNLVQIGHNVVLGRGCVLCGQVGVSGSTQLDDFVMVGGQGGLAGHLRIGRGAQIAAKSGIMRDIAPGTVVAGIPAQPIGEFLRQTALLHRLIKKKDR